MKTASGISRRSFLGQAGVLATVPVLVAGRALSSGIFLNDRTIREPAQEIPVVSSADVVVCGGGPAGFAAAVSAARKGASVTLIESQGCLGGIWTCGLLVSLLDYENKAGLMAELVSLLDARGARAYNSLKQPTQIFDPEVVKLLLEMLCEEAGVKIHLHTGVAAAVKTGRWLTHIITESVSGRTAIAGSVFVDATGNGNLGALSGCGFDFGHPESGMSQPMSMLALIGGLNAPDIREFFVDEPGQPWAPPKIKLREIMERGGHTPSYSKPTLWRVRDDLFCMMANHEYGVSGLSEPDVTRATLRARRELHAMIDALRSAGGIWENIYLVATPEQIGIREGRRLHGLYTLSVDDLKEGRRFDDGICRVTFNVDIHSLDPSKHKEMEEIPWQMKAYDIPLRALIAKDVDNLMFAGRCISGDFFAHASYRVTGNAVVMGEAAGKASAAAVRRNCFPSEVNVSELG
jgi:hypothetical protein